MTESLESTKKCESNCYECIHSEVKFTTEPPLEYFKGYLFCNKHNKNATVQCDNFEPEDIL